MRTNLRSVVTALLLATMVTTVSGQQKAPPKTKAAPKPTAEENYSKTCQVCHGIQGKAPLPTMSLADGEWKFGNSVQAIAKVITDGIPGTAMLPNKDRFSKEEIQALARLVRTFDPKLKKGSPPRVLGVAGPKKSPSK
jgi:mono/diheme cytochrome c family protein